MVLRFCPYCANLLRFQENRLCNRFACPTCPYIYQIAEKHRVTSRTYFTGKERADILDAESAWMGVESTDERCPKCSHPRAYFKQMLQSRVCSHVASRLSLKVWSSANVRYIMSPSSMGPMKVIMNKAKEEMDMLGPEEKHFYCGGDRSVAMAAELLRQGKVIAIPTDTVYGLACLAANSQAVQRLYEIKRRDEGKPLAICLSNVKEVGTWGILDDIPGSMLEYLLPGPYTICLRRTSALNRALNPGLDTVGIRVPDDKFVRSVAQIVGPLALTSANVSSEPSSLHPDEFRALWPELDGVFHGSKNRKKQNDARRIGSTVVDVSRPGCFTVMRHGIGANYIIGVLRKHGLNMTTAE